LSEGFDVPVKGIGRPSQFRPGNAADMEANKRAAICILWLHNCIGTNKPEFRRRDEIPASKSTWRGSS